MFSFGAENLFAQSIETLGLQVAGGGGFKFVSHDDTIPYSLYFTLHALSPLYFWIVAAMHEYIGSSLETRASEDGTEYEHDEAYHLGQAAADDGKSRMANPFIRSSDERAFCAWLDGYNDRIAPLERQLPDWSG